jgi:hypothetical protein
VRLEKAEWSALILIPCTYRLLDPPAPSPCKVFFFVVLESELRAGA